MIGIRNLITMAIARDDEKRLEKSSGKVVTNVCYHGATLLQTQSMSKASIA
jgi:hypothetical protein